MHTRGVGLVAAITALAGCATNRFDALMRFVPPGAESLMLMDHAKAPGVFGDDGTDTTGPSRVIYSGGKFRLRGVGYGDWEGVTLLQWDQPRTASELLGKPDAEERWIEVGGHMARFVPGHPREGELESWCVVMDETTVLHATRRALLERALEGDGESTAATAARLGWSEGIDWRAPLLIFRKFDRSNRDDCYSPFGSPLGQVPHGFDIAGFCLAVTQAANGGPITMHYRARTDDPAEALAWFGFHTGAERRGWACEVHRHHYESGQLTHVESFVPSEWDWRWLSWHVLFGFNLFI